MTLCKRQQNNLQFKAKKNTKITKRTLKNGKQSKKGY